MCPDGRSKTDLRNSRRRFFSSFSNFLEKFLSVAAGTEKLLMKNFLSLASSPLSLYTWEESGKSQRWTVLEV